MENFLASHNLILSVQAWSHPILDVFFLAVTSLGDSSFFMLALAYLFWCGDLRTAIRLASIFLLSTVGIYFLKDYFALPRPDSAVVRNFQLGVEISESFPSGHAAGSAVFWGYVAYLSRKRWVCAACVLLIALVSFSRIYLGVHFLRDVLGGIALGALVLALALLFFNYRDRHPVRFPSWLLWLLAVAVPVLLAALFNEDRRIARSMGALMGVWIGYLIRGQGIPLNRPSSWMKKAVRMALGAAGGALLYGLLKYGLFQWIPVPMPHVKPFLIYSVMGFYLAYFYPWVLKRFAGHL